MWRLILLAGVALPVLAGPAPEAALAFDRYSAQVERGSATTAPGPNTSFAIDRITPAGLFLPGALLHHWRGMAFVPNATIAGIESLLKDFNSYPQYFAPQVLSARVVSGAGDHVQAEMRVRQHHVITVVLDSVYDVSFGRLDERHGYSTSRSTQIDEVGADEDHGYLWRLNTYWTYAEARGGLYLRMETVSLTRSVPRGLGWVIGPYVESIPRESMEFTLRAVCAELKKGRAK